jgi:uncharacterized membrane protein SpoIIM required for sporulation/ABC-type transport system involved in multi-copper enzyme maturation permease subunit
MANALHPVFVIARREVRDQFRDWRIIFPILGLTVFFPFLMNFTASQMLGFVNKYGADIIGERLIPFLLMIVGFFPISVSLVIALESFVGEKERGSIEPLLNTPLKDWQLYLGKLLAATVPPLVSSYLGMAVYMSGLVFSNIPLPELSLLILVLFITTIQAVMMVAGAVVVSSQATSVRSANLLSSFIILPVAFLIQGESLVMFWGDYITLWWVVFGLFVLSILLVRVGLAHFQREELLGREIDVLNLRWGWRVFRNAFTGGAKNILDWYRNTVIETVYRLRWAILLVVVSSMGAILIGMRLVDVFPINIKGAGVDIGERIQGLMRYWPLFSFAPAAAIWWQNVRALLLGLVLGVFSFGILGMLPLFITMIVVGYLFQILATNGLPAATYMTGLILPHGIFEIPAAILATAAVVQAGARLATPTSAETIGEAWIRSLADWAKIMLALVIPLLAVASLVETWITPQVAAWLIK